MQKLALVLASSFIAFYGSSALAAPGCTSTEMRSGDRDNKPVVDTSERLKMSGTLMPNGEVVCVVGMDYKKPSQNERHRVERGSVNGVKYRIYYSDGSGSIQGDPASTMDTIKDIGRTNWTIGCRFDGMADKNWCDLDKKDLTVGIWKDGSQYISIGGDHYPGTNITIRVGQNKPISAPEKSGFSQAQVREIVKQMMVGEKALTRYQEWPYRDYVDEEISLYGFSEALNILSSVYKASKP